MDRRLGGRGRELVERELRQRCEENEGSGGEEEPERKEQVQQVVEVAALKRLREDAPGVRDRCLRDPARRPADRVVSPVERRVCARVEVWDDDRDGNRRDEQARSCDRRAGSPPALERVPEPEAGDDESDLLLRRHRQDGEHREGEQAVLVEVPEREEEERAGERDRVELVQRQPLGRGVEEVDEREGEPRPVVAQVLAREAVDRQRSERDCDRLRGQQQLRARPEPPERREGGEDRVEVRGEPGDLPAVAARHLEDVSVRGVPDGLHHVPEVVAAGRERPVPQDRQRGESGCVRRHRRPEEHARPHSNPSISPRQRAPSTSSLACAR